MYRKIYMADHNPPKPVLPSAMGLSVAHWEDDTLVVETMDFIDGISFQYGSGPGLPPLNTVGPNIQAEGKGPPGAPPAGAPPGPPPGASLPPGLPPPGSFPDLSKAIWGPHGPNMHMVERMHLVDQNTLEIQLTITDDSVWTKPYQTQKRTWRRIVKGVSELGPFSGEPEEWVCTKAITSFDPETNTYVDKDPEEMVKYLDSLGK